MSTRPTILLDKSYLQGGTKEEVGALCDDYTVLLTETVLFEILTADSAKRRACFTKLPQRSNPVEIVPPLGRLMRWEVENKQPCGPVENHRLLSEWTVSPALENEDFTFTTEQCATIAEWLDEEDEFVDGFLNRVEIAGQSFPTLGSAKPSDRLGLALDLCTKIATDRNGILEFYEATRKDGFPPPEILTEEWAIFRWYQIQMAATAEFFARHGHAPAAKRDKILNERLDLDHTGVALLVKRLASGDTAMVRRFTTLCPDGELLTYAGSGLNPSGMVSISPESSAAARSATS